MTNNVKLIRFLGAEEVMAEVVNDTGTTMTLKNAVRIVVFPNQADPKNPQVGLAPFLQFSDDKEIVINKDLVITVATPLTEFLNQYNSIHGGIQIASNKLIVP